MITAMIDHADGDLWVMPVNTKSFESTSMLNGQERFRLLATPGIHKARELVAGFAVWTRPDGGSTPVIVVGVDPQDPALMPWNMVVGGFSDLAVPDSVIIDDSYMQSLGVTAVGEQAEIRKSPARVVALTHRIRSFTNSPFVFTTVARARKFVGADANSSSYYLIGLDPGMAADGVRGELGRKLGKAEILSTAEFRSRSLAQWLYRTGAGAALLGGAILGVIVGTAIVTQTLYASTKEHINEYATLRALGSSSLYLNKVILSQALLSAMIGFGLSAIISLIIVAATADTAVPVVMTPLLTTAIFALTVTMCALSSLSAILQIMRIDPVVVFTR
jgi:putative ABC transport system permease protein